MNIEFETSKLLNIHWCDEDYCKYFSPSGDRKWYVFHEDVIGSDRRKDEDFIIHTKDTPVCRYDLPCNRETLFTIPYDSWHAPEQYDVQTFLREKYSIHIEISPYVLSQFDGDSLRFSYNISKQDGNTLNNHKFQSGFETYEDALEQAIVVSLKITING